VNILFHRPSLRVGKLLLGRRRGGRNPCAPNRRCHRILRASPRVHGAQRVCTSLAAGKFKYAEFLTRRCVGGGHFEPAAHNGFCLWHDAPPWAGAQHSQSPMEAPIRAVIEPLCHFRSRSNGQYCSIINIYRITTCAGRSRPRRGRSGTRTPYRFAPIEKLAGTFRVSATLVNRERPNPSVSDALAWISLRG
jgi:hypothetical protein